MLTEQTILRTEERKLMPSRSCDIPTQEEIDELLSGLTFKSLIFEKELLLVPQALGFRICVKEDGIVTHRSKIKKPGEVVTMEFKSDTYVCFWDKPFVYRLDVA